MYSRGREETNKWMHRTRAMTPQLTTERMWRRVGDPGCYAVLRA